MGQRVREVLMSVKRALLPYMPDGVMRQYRLRRELLRARLGRREQAAPSPVNVDVIVDRTHARRWLLATGDTYRVVDPATPIVAPPDPAIIVPAGADTAGAERWLGWQGIDAVVVGNVVEPRWSDKSTAGNVEPRAIVVAPDVLDEVGGPPDGPAPLPGLLARIADAGHRIGLVPTTVGTIDPTRHDPIEGDAVVILAAVPLHDVGGGSRGAQIALELVRRGYHVTYVNRYPSYEAVDLGLRFIHPQLEQVSAAHFDVDVYLSRCSGDGLAIVEIPDPGYGSDVAALQRGDWSIVFDIIDDWSDRALGGDWYDPTFEHELIREASAVVGSASDLVDRATRAGRTDAALVPNAVSESVFGGEVGERPKDLPHGSLIGYHGSLYGDWFDWDGLRAVANANADATIVLIGEARGVPTDVPDNVTFLGLKAQGDLPAYLHHLDVGLVPFTVTPTTHAVSPLKVFEYLACGVPVAAPPLRAVDGLEGVYTDVDLVAAVDIARHAPRPDPAEALGRHSWGARLAVLFDAVRRPLHDVTGASARVERRPVTHYRWRRRHVRR